VAAAHCREGKLADLTGPGRTDRWGVSCTDLGTSVIAPDGSLVSVFGDTFSGEVVGQGDWRSPVILIGTGDACHPITYHRAGGTDPEFAQQLWRYQHRTGKKGGPRRGISTVIPSDLLRVGNALYLHAIVNRGFGNVVWTEIWRSDDSAVSWRRLGGKSQFPTGLHGGHAQCWSWDYDPVDGWIYVASTGFQRDKGIILQRVCPEHIADRRKYFGWGRRKGLRSWATAATPVTPAGETWGELSLRRLVTGGARRAAATAGGRIRVGRRRSRRQPRGPTLRWLRPAGLQARRGRRCWAGGVAVEHHTRLALSRNAIHRDAARYH
jgi:hypothetical protein